MNQNATNIHGNCWDGQNGVSEEFGDTESMVDSGFRMIIISVLWYSPFPPWIKSLPFFSQNERSTLCILKQSAWRPVMPVQADIQRQHALVIQTALPRTKNTVMGTGTHKSRANFFFLNFTERELRLQLLPCLAMNKIKRAPAWIIKCTGGTRHTSYQWVTRTDRKLLVDLDNQQLRCFLKCVLDATYVRSVA